MSLLLSKVKNQYSGANENEHVLVNLKRQILSLAGSYLRSHIPVQVHPERAIIFVHVHVKVKELFSSIFGIFLVIYKAYFCL